MRDKIRWGILATGGIAAKFAKGLTVLPDAELFAVGSRTEKTAEDFAREFGAQRAYSSYNQLAKDKNVDVIYISSPHPFHMENTILCLEAGKAVLCEKPFAINAQQAGRMIEIAGKQKVFLMEAMWTRFIPVMRKVRDILQQGLIGQVQFLHANFGYRAQWNPTHRLFDAELGGGAFLDVGVYCLSLASMVFGKPPSKISSMAHIGTTGIDEQSAFILGYDKGSMAVLTSAISTNTANEAVISGTKGAIRIQAPFHCPTQAVISIERQAERLIEIPLEGSGYNYEAQEVMDCIRAGKLESDTIPLKETLEIIETMDKIRAQWNLRYPSEENENYRDNIRFRKD